MRKRRGGGEEEARRRRGEGGGAGEEDVWRSCSCKEDEVLRRRRSPATWRRMREHPTGPWGRRRPQYQRTTSGSQCSTGSERRTTERQSQRRQTLRGEEQRKRRISAEQTSEDSSAEAWQRGSVATRFLMAEQHVLPFDPQGGCVLAMRPCLISLWRSQPMVASWPLPQRPPG